MTNTVYEFDVPLTRPGDTPRLSFTLNGEPFQLMMPKLSVAVSLLNTLENNGTVTQLESGLALAQAMWGLLDYIVAEPPHPALLPNPEWTEDAPDDVMPDVANPEGGKLRGRARIMQRLNNPNDALDVDSLARLLGRMIGVMFGGRPTTPPRGSSDPPANGGSASEGPTHDTQAATS